MANFDTAAKRFSGMGLELAEAPLLPIPDGALSASDRQHFLDAYSGIAFGAEVVPTTDDDVSGSVLQESIMGRSVVHRPSPMRHSTWRFSLPLLRLGDQHGRLHAG